MSRPCALITGCSKGGIGDALVREFAARGYRVFATLRDTSKAAVYDETTDIETVTLDVTSSESIRSLKQYIESQVPSKKLDILVNNAGIGATGPLLEIDLEDAKRVYDVNVMGLLAVTQSFAPMLVAAGGRIVNCSSVGALVTLPWGGLYHSSKAAVSMMSEILRLELAPLGVTVITAMLGAIQSNFHMNDTWRGLRDTSVYKPVEAQIAKVAHGEVGPKREDAAEFSKRLVNDVLGGASGQIWRGAMAQTVRVLGYHAPSTLMDRMLLPDSGLNTLAKNTP